MYRVDRQRDCDTLAPEHRWDIRMTTLPRLHLFELEDQSWFPATIRDLATDYIRFLGIKFMFHVPAVPLMAEALRLTGATQVVDLCAGARWADCGFVPGTRRGRNYAARHAYGSIPKCARIPTCGSGIERTDFFSL